MNILHPVFALVLLNFIVLVQIPIARVVHSFIHCRTTMSFIDL